MGGKSKPGELFLSGGGTERDSFLLDRKFVRDVEKRKSSILYIPLALNRDWFGFESCYEWFVNTVGLHSSKFIDVTMWADENLAPPSNLNSFDAVYIGGGGTYKLLDVFTKHQFTETLKEFYRNGGIIYGGSAGAIILGRDIRTVSGEDEGGRFTFTSGLGLVGAYSIICHFTKKEDLFIREFIKKYKHPVIALPESCGIVIEGRKGSVVGKGHVYIYELSSSPKMIKNGGTLLI